MRILNTGTNQSFSFTQSCGFGSGGSGTKWPPVAKFLVSDRGDIVDSGSPGYIGWGPVRLPSARVDSIPAVEVLKNWPLEPDPYHLSKIQMNFRKVSILQYLMIYY
jgi:hypothetical protein